MAADYQLLKRTLHMKYPHSVYFYSGAVGSGLATFSKHPIESVQFHRFPVAGRLEEIFRGDGAAGKGVAVTRIRTEADGRQIILLNSHFAANYFQPDGWNPYETHKTIQAFEFVRVMRQELLLNPGAAVIGLGDFNLEPDSPAYEGILLNKLGLFQDFKVHSIFGTSSSDREPETFNLPSNSYRKQGRPIESIDHILVATTGNVRWVPLQSKRVFEERIPVFNISYSDHFGLASTVEFREGPPEELDESEDDYDSILVLQLIEDSVVQHIGRIQAEQSVRQWRSMLLTILAILLMAGGCWLAADTRYLISALSFTLAILAFTLGFLELFRAVIFAADERAAHLQFLQEI